MYQHLHAGGVYKMKIGNLHQCHMDAEWTDLNMTYPPEMVFNREFHRPWGTCRVRVRVSGIISLCPSRQAQNQLVGVAFSIVRNFGFFSGTSGVFGALSAGVARLTNDDLGERQRQQV